MSWQLIEKSEIDQNELCLYKDGPDFMIRVDGLELMNSRCSTSEEYLAKVASWCTPNLEPKILLGGLGLGFSYWAFSKEFPKANLVVAEISESIIKWFEQHFRSQFFPNFSFSGSIAQSQVQCTIQEKVWDLIVLDVDNGPQPLSTNDNESLYSLSGLKKIASHLSAEGTLVVWSAFEDEDFLKRAQAAGYSTICLPVKVHNERLEHFLLICTKSQAHAKNHHFLQAGLYDAYVENYQEDVSFYQSQLIGKSKVLEVGAGTGRLATALSEGKTYHALDTSAAMLHQLKRKCDIVCFHGDIHSIIEEYDAIFFPYRVFPYYSSAEQMNSTLEKSAQHLLPEGCLIINMLNFAESFIDQWNDQILDYSFVGPDSQKWVRRDYMKFDRAKKIMFRTVDLVLDNQTIASYTDNLRWCHPDELADMAANHGLRLVGNYRAFCDEPYTDQQEFVAIYEKA